MEYIAQEVTKSQVLVLKARIIKAIALIEIGYINEAYMIYQRILDCKDLPVHGSRGSEQLIRQDGINFTYDIKTGYRNDLSPEAEENQGVLTSL
jgi:hypothetical protein